MSNPLDTNDFKHYLKFISLGSEIPHQIAEPPGYDGAKFVIEQDAKRYGRDLKYGALDKLEFPNAVTNNLSDTEQVYNPQGDTSNFLDYGFEWLLFIYRKYGFESKVEYILEKNGVSFSFGMLDFSDKKVFDGHQFTFKLLEKNKVQNVKRRFDNKFNAFSTKDINESDITPMQTFNYLRRATPLFQESKWSTPANTKLFAGAFEHVNPCQQINESGIDFTLSWLEAGFLNPTNAINNMRMIRAKNNLSNIKVRLDNNVNINYKVTSPDSNSHMRMSLYYVIFDGTYNSSEDDKVYVYEKEVTGSVWQIVPIDNVIEFDLPNISRDKYLHIGWDLSWDITNLGSGAKGSFDFNSHTITITATSTAIDQVIKVSRWIDLIKQSQKFNQNIPVNASLFEEGGLHYDNVVFNKRMMTQRTDYFYSSVKDVLESVKEVNNDYEFSEEELFISHESDFYKNQEIAVFELITDNDQYSEEFNDRAMSNTMNYGYKTYEKDRTTQGTSESIHTESEWRILNENVENTISVKNDFVRDSIAIQKAYDLEINQPTSSTDDNDNIYIENIVALPPSTKGGFSANLLMRFVDGVLEILNQSSNANTNDTDVAFIWTNLGIGSQFTITEGENIGTYSVTEITPNILKLTPIGFTPDFEGDAFITFEYFYSGVFYQTRTNQGFAVVSGISNKFGNLFYSIKRNLKYFAEQMAMMTFYCKKNITLGEFKNNGEVATRLTTETELVQENAPILYSSLPNPLITPLIISGTAKAEFSEILAYLEAYKVNRGFVRIIENGTRVYKGYFKKMSHNWKFNEMDFDLEQKFEPEILMLIYADGVLNVNDAPYNLSGVSDWWRFENEFLQLFDEKSRPISNKYEFNSVNLNGIIYDSKDLLIEALLTL